MYGAWGSHTRSSLGQTALGEEASPAMFKILGKSEIFMKRLFLRVTDMIRHHDVIIDYQFVFVISVADKTSPYMLVEGTNKL